MGKIAKIVVTILIVFASFLSLALVSAPGYRPGMFGLIVFAATYGAIRTVWKSEKDSSKDNNNDNSGSILQK